MEFTTHPVGSFSEYKYVVSLAVCEKQILLSRQKLKDAWETQGGHVEPGETPHEAARRELFEEAGITGCALTPVFDYTFPNGLSDDQARGMAFLADVTQLGALPDSEMAEVKAFEELPENLAYPELTQFLYSLIKNV